MLRCSAHLGSHVGLILLKRTLKLERTKPDSKVPLSYAKELPHPVSQNGLEALEVCKQEAKGVGGLGSSWSLPIPGIYHCSLPRKGWRKEGWLLLTLPSSSTTWICPESQSFTTAPMGTSNSWPDFRSIHT